MRAFLEMFRGGRVPYAVREDFERKIGQDRFDAILKRGLIHEGPISDTYPSRIATTAILKVTKNYPGAGRPYQAVSTSPKIKSPVLTEEQVRLWVASVPRLHKLIQDVLDIQPKRYPTRFSDENFIWLGHTLWEGTTRDVVLIEDLTWTARTALDRLHRSPLMTLALAFTRSEFVPPEDFVFDGPGGVTLRFLEDLLLVQDGNIVRADERVVVPPCAVEVPEFECNDTGVIQVLAERECNELRIERRDFDMYIDRESGGPNHGLVGYTNERGKFIEDKRTLAQVDTAIQLIAAKGSEVPLRQLRAISEYENPRWHFNRARNGLDVMYKRNHWRSFHEESVGAFVFRPPPGLRYLVIRRRS